MSCHLFMKTNGQILFRAYAKSKTFRNIEIWYCIFGTSLILKPNYLIRVYLDWWISYSCVKRGTHNQKKISVTAILWPLTSANILVLLLLLTSNVDTIVTTIYDIIWTLPRIKIYFGLLKLPNITTQDEMDLDWITCL